MPDSLSTRRAVLRTAGLVALAGGGAAGLVGCSPDGGTAAPAPSTAPAGTAAASPSPAVSSPAAPSSPTPSAKSSASASKSVKPPSGPSVATSEVKVGGGVILEDADYVITQPSKGDFKAFSKICTHQRCPVTEVSGGTINCKCHGSKFSIKDGSVVNPPAPKPLAESKVTVVGGKVYVDD